MELRNIKILSLFVELKEKNIGLYLLTSKFTILLSKHDIDDLWLGYYEEIELYTLSKNPGLEVKNIQDKFFSFIDDYYSDAGFIDEFIHDLIIDFYCYIEKDIDFEPIYIGLELIQFPNEILKSIKKKIKASRVEIIKKKEITKLELPNLKDIKLDWINRISKAKTLEVIEEMKQYAFEKNEMENIKSIVSQSQRWYRLQDKVNNGTIKLDDEQVECSKINNALIDIIHSLFDLGSNN